MSPDMTKAPCGCVFGSVNDVFVIEPCSDTCEVYAYAVTESRKKGMPVGEIDMRDSGNIDAFVPRCSSCDAKVDGWTGPRGKQPKPGDLSLCVYCGEFSIYADDDMRKPTKRELRQIADNEPEAMNMQRIIRAKPLEYKGDERKPKT
jgi:hypothetical protein